MKNKLLLIVAMILLFGTAGLSHALVMTYTDRATWETAAGGVAYSEDFESYTADTSFANTTVDVGNFSLTSVNSTTFANLIDVTPFDYSGIPSSFGDVAVSIFVEDSQQVTMAFDTGISSWFADFLWAGNTTQLTLELSSGDAIQVPGPGTDLESFGFISTDLISSIIFKNTANDGFYLDNVAVGGAESVPEPATMLLLGTGLIGLAGLRRRFKK